VGLDKGTRRRGDKEKGDKARGDKVKGDKVKGTSSPLSAGLEKGRNIIVWVKKVRLSRNR